MTVRHLVFDRLTEPVADRCAPGVHVARACVATDAAAIAAVVEAAGGVADGADFPVISPAGLLADLASRPGREVAVWLARRAAAFVGIAAAVTAGEAPAVRHSIAWLLVGATARRRGVGSALVMAALDHARRSGAREVWVETRADWAEAEALWSALGFRPR